MSGKSLEEQTAWFIECMNKPVLEDNDKLSNSNSSNNVQESFNTASPARTNSHGSYGEYTGQCEFNGQAERCFIKEIGTGLHKVTWLSDGVQAVYTESNQGPYVEQNGRRYPADVSGGC